MDASSLIIYTQSAAAVVQAGTSAVLLAIYGRNAGPRAWAGPAAFGLLAFAFSAGVFPWTGLYHIFPYLAYFQVIAAFLVPPAFFFFAASLLLFAPRPVGHWSIHFAPAAIAAIIFLPYFAPVTAEKMHQLLNTLTVVWPVLALQSGIYIGMSAWIVVKDIRRLRDVFSFRGSDAENRLKRLIVIFLLVWGIWIIDLTAEATSILSVYEKSILGAFRVFGLVVVCTMTVAPTPLVPPMPVYENSNASSHAEKPRYNRSSLDAEAAQRITTRIDAIMREQKVYRNAFLTLQDLSAACGVPSHKLSQALNAHLGKSFFDYVNEWRIEDVKNALESGSDGTLLSLATDAGFNSKSTFNSAFKKLTGKTPSQFRQSVNN